MIATRSQRKSASSIACVVRMIASSGSRSRMSSNMSQIERRLCGSRPVVGSSRKRTRGEWSTPRAISRRRRMPPESSRADWFRRSQSPTWWRRCSMRPRERAAREAVHLALDREVLADREVLVRRLGLRHGADRAADGRPLADDVVALDPGRARASAAGASSASGSAWSCRRRWGRAGRRSRRAERGRTPRRRRRTRRSASSVARPRSPGSSSRPRRLASRFDHEGLAGDDRGVEGLEAHREGLQVAALEAPVLARRELRARLDRDDARLEAGVGPRLRPDGDGLADGEGREPLLRDLDAQVGRLDLERDDRPVPARPTRPCGGGA